MIIPNNLQHLWPVFYFLFPIGFHYIANNWKKELQSFRVSALELNKIRIPIKQKFNFYKSSISNIKLYHYDL